uniref:Uncharacterized protein n=1 Tax=Sphaerodactylus townsendi TaxID=933632 RepID=A0ACB8FIB5_9SAUR
MDALRVWWVLLGILGAGSAQLQLQKFGSILMDTCNSTVIIPCIVTNLQLNDTRAMKEAIPGNYSCEVTESNREGISTVELKQAIEQYQLLLFHSV